MRVTIIASESRVGVDGEFRVVDLTGLAMTIHAVQWDSVLREGEIEYRRPDPPGNEKITDFSRFQVFVDRWTAAAPPPPLPDEPPGPDPDDELDAALAALDPATVTSLAATRTFLVDMLKALRGGAGKAGRVAGRPA